MSEGRRGQEGLRRRWQREPRGATGFCSGRRVRWEVTRQLTECRDVSHPRTESHQLLYSEETRGKGRKKEDASGGHCLRDEDLDHVFSRRKTIGGVGLGKEPGVQRGQNWRRRVGPGWTSLEFRAYAESGQDVGVWKPWAT